MIWGGVIPLLGCWGEDVPKDEVCINGRFAYTIKRKPLKAGNVQTEAYR